MDEIIALHSAVKFLGVQGRVVGLWMDEDVTTRYNVRYLDGNGVVREVWMGRSCLELA